MVEIGVGAGLTVAGERGLQRFCGRRSTQPGVAVHVVGADGPVRDDTERVVLLQEELSGRVEADCRGSVFVEQGPGPFDDASHGVVPRRLDQPTVLPDERAGQSVLRRTGLPSVEILDVDATTVDTVVGPAADADDPVVDHRDVEGIAVGMQDRRRANPTLHLVRTDSVAQMLIDPDRPSFTRRVRGAPAPEVVDAIGHDSLPTTSRRLRTVGVYPTASGVIRRPWTAIRRRPITPTRLWVALRHVRSRPVTDPLRATRSELDDLGKGVPGADRFLR